MQMDISFTCKCGEVIDETVAVPEPSFMAEKSKDSGTEYIDGIYCPSCGDENEVCVINTFSGADCYINNGDTEVNFGMPYYPESDYGQEELEWFIDSKLQIDIFQNQIKSVEKLLNIEVDEETYLILKKSHANNKSVADEAARYKVLAIENEAPEYIKDLVI